MNVTTFLPSLTNLPVFYTAWALALLLLVLSSHALLLRMRPRPSGAHPALRLRTRLIVLAPAWALWAVWAGYGAWWLVVAGLVAGSWLFVALGAAALIAFLLFSVLLVYWLRGRVWADAAMVVMIMAASALIAVKYTLWLCEPLGRSGFASAQMCTGQLYAEGRGGAIRDPQLAADWYRRAAEQGVAEAQYVLGTILPVRQQREYWLRQAAQQRHGRAAHDLYILLGQRDEDLDWLKLAVEQNVPDALYRMALRTMSGSAVARDLERARQLLQAAARAGSAGAMRALAFAYAGDGILFDHSDELSRQWEARVLAAPRPQGRVPEDERVFATTFETDLARIRKRYAEASSGDPAAQQSIARDILAAAHDDPAAVAKAYRWLEKAAASGVAEAQFSVAEYYLGLANATAAQQESGRRWLIAAADAGHPAALRRLINAYKNGGFGLSHNLEQAKAYGERLLAALEASGVAQNQAAWLAASWEHAETLRQLQRERDQYLPPDALARAAKAGDPQAQYQRAREVMAQDFTAGVDLLQAAADGGFAEAQYHAARQVRTRKSTPESLRRAVAWLTAAAEQGHRGAMHELGMVHAQGIKDIGLAPDPARARSLFKAALDGGGDVLYRYTDASGHGWMITAQQVQRALERIPEQELVR